MNFQDVVNNISARSPFQRKKLAAYLETNDDVFFREANSFTNRYGSYLSKRGIKIDYVIDAYLKMCSDMLRCQVDFLRTGKYPVTSADHAKKTVYESETEMLSYMVGLGISQFLWSTHYAMFSFFKKAIDSHSQNTSTYLEIGPGHGLFLEYALSKMDHLKSAMAIDISPTSLELTRSIIKHFMPQNEKIHFKLGDVTKVDFENQFDFITMGEVLEHVDKPNELLQSLKGLLTSTGKAFVSTCAHCPAIDHVSQFSSVAEMRLLIQNAGLKIIQDLPLPVEPVSVEEAELKRITINYCALVEKS